MPAATERSTCFCTVFGALLALDATVLAICTLSERGIWHGYAIASMVSRTKINPSVPPENLKVPEREKQHIVRCENDVLGQQ